MVIAPPDPNSTLMTESELVKKADEFERRWQSARPMLFKSALKLTKGNDDEAEDIVQDACLRSFRAYGEFDGTCAFNSWAYVILLNASISRKGTSSQPLPTTASCQTEC